MLPDVAPNMCRTHSARSAGVVYRVRDAHAIAKIDTQLTLLFSWR